MFSKTPEYFLNYCVAVLILFLSQTVFAVNYTVKLGDSRVVIYFLAGQGKTYIHLHHNEQTALKAAKAVIQKQGGALITLVHSGGRNVVFHLNETRYEFDPNRIFTDKGIQKTLTELSQYTPEAHKEVNKLALKLKQIIPHGKIIAVHNNSTYSLRNYLPGHELASDAEIMHLDPKNHYRNFYLVTQLSDYLRLKLQGFNGILQKPSARDDGSLSVLLAKSDYINVEAGYDQLTEQIKMLQYA
jgi:hypothetical protein